MTLATEAAAQPAQDRALAQKFYFAAWRWHFYAGLYVIPFLLMLAVTGLIMVYANSIETRWGEKVFVTQQSTQKPLLDQATAAVMAVPGGALTQYIAPRTPDRAGLFIVNADDVAHVVAVDPYTAEVKGDVIKEDTWFRLCYRIHGTLLIGTTGDRLIEIAASLGVVVLVTGLYMWWPRNGRGWRQALLPNLALKRRQLWKELHVSIGFYVSIALVFFLLSGLAWAGIWGDKYVQAWSTFPAEKWDNVPLSDKTHASLNGSGIHEAPWGIEQTPMPASGSDLGAKGVPEGEAINLQSVNDLARKIGFADQYRINLPQGDTGVYTISADSMDGDTNHPTGDRTVHVDQYTGKILAELGFADYSLAAKAMAVGTALHQGDMGLWNTILNLVFCSGIIFLCISGVVMWWMRRPSGALRIAAPPMPANMPLWKGAVALMLAISLAFPLAGLTLIAVLALDMLVISRLPALKRALS